MPEGHSVHRLARAFEELFAGQRLHVSSPQGRFAAGAAVLDGQALTGTVAWGKHLFHLFDEQILHTHLGLYGSWVFDGDETFLAPHSIGAPRRRIGEKEVLAAVGSLPRPSDWQAPEPRGQVRVRLRSDHGIADLTGPNQCRVLTIPEAAAIIAGLGPDPLWEGKTSQSLTSLLGREVTSGQRERFLNRVRQLSRPVGELVMDQAVVAGPGNIYRAEALFLAGIHPWRPGKRTGRERLGELWDLLVTLMDDGVRTGVIRSTPPGCDGDYYIYHRTGLPCRNCGRPIIEEAMAGRKLYRCGICQR